jgi:hypothetical protein
MWLVNGLASFTSASTGLTEISSANKIVERIFFMGFLAVVDGLV